MNSKPHSQKNCLKKSNPLPSKIEDAKFLANILLIPTEFARLAGSVFKYTEFAACILQNQEDFAKFLRALILKIEKLQ